MAKEKCIAVQLGVIYDSQVTRKQWGLLVSAAFPCVLLSTAWQSYDSQLAEINKNTTTNRQKLLLFDLKIT
jgi:hypothetical protein